MFRSASPEAIQAEIETLAGRATPGDDWRTIVETWLGIVRTGDALNCFATVVNGRPVPELIVKIKTAWVGAGTILWQRGNLAVATKPCARKVKTKAEVRLLGEDLMNPLIFAGLEKARI